MKTIKNNNLKHSIKVNARNERYDLIAEICANSSLEEAKKALNLPKEKLKEVLIYRSSWVFAGAVSNHNKPVYSYIIETGGMLEHINLHRIMDSFCVAALNGHADTVTYFLGQGIMNGMDEKIDLFMKSYDFEKKDDIALIIKVHREKTMISSSIEAQEDRAAYKDNKI